MHLEINDRIRVRKLNFFDSFEIHSKYDSLGSTFKFNFFFNPNNIEHKEMACVGHYHIAYLKEGDDLLMTGYILSQGFTDAPQQELVSIEGYSLTGVLEDSQIPTGTATSWFTPMKGYAKKVINKVWPGALQSNNLSLKEIIEKHLNPFDLKYVVDDSVAADADKKYDEVTAKESQTIKSYLCELAAQKNIVLTDDEFGRLLLTRPKPNQTPIFHFERGDKQIPGTKMRLVFNGQGMHSHIRVVQQQDEDESIPASEEQIENPYVPLVFRPHLSVQNSGNSDDTKQSAKNILSKELKNVTLTIETDRWHVNGKLFKPGQIISVTNPYVYLYKKSNWFIEEVILRGDAKQKVATLKCVLPCVYDGTTPQYLWAGINLH
jgi:prophage tail gpP-like protein